MAGPCRFILKYPDESNPTLTFEPTLGAILTGSKLAFRHNAFVHEMFDPRVAYTYVKGGAFRERTYDFLLLPAEVESFWTFWSAVFGNKFKLLDPFSDPNYVLQRFAPTSTEPQPTLVGDDRWSVSLVFRDALA